MNKHRKITVHISLVAALILGGLATHARVDRASAQETLLNKLPKVDKKQPLLLQADQVTYDNQNNKVLASGNVEVYYNNYILLADRLIYSQSNNTLVAEGNVRIKEPGGAITNADRIQLKDDFTEGFVESLKVVTKEDAKIAAEKASRVDENTIIFKKGTFTPCKKCKNRKNPLWQIKAYKIIHKKDEKNIYYEDASLELFGVPVAYIPFFSHPDPTVKRRSGFLIPRVNQSKELGFTFEAPYFYNIAPNMDFTFSPRVTTKQGVLWKGQWRHRTENGSYSVKADGIFEKDPQTDEDFRGSVETKGAYKLGSWWNWGWDITAETDDTYRRVYELDSRIVTNRVSKVYMIGQTERNWFEANLYHFGALTSFDVSSAEAFVHPVVDYNYTFEDPFLSGELTFDVNAVSLSRDNGADINRLAAQLKWRRTLVDTLGQTWTPFLQARGDVSQVSNVEDAIAGTTGDRDFIARGTATAGMTYSYPFIARSASASHILKPTAQIIARPDVGDQTDIPNEDARSLVFDDTLLFDVDKFSGYDRIETGVRANFGVEYTLQMDSGGYARAVFGQSYHVSGENSFDEGTGLGKDQSDYVAGVYYEPSSNFTLISQARFDEKSFDVKRTDVFMKASYGPINATVNYANIDASAEEIAIGITEREELLASGSLKISDYWSVFGSMRYNLDAEPGKSGFIEDSIGLKYSDECFVLAVTYNESNISDDDLSKNQSVMVRFELKHLGGTDFSTDISDDFIANSDDNKN